MPATDLRLQYELRIAGFLRATQEMSVVDESLVSGKNGFDAMKTTLNFGPDDNEAEEWYTDEFTIASGAGGTNHFDLAGSLVSQLHGGTLTFTVVKLLVVAIDAPNGTKKLQVGPQGVAAAWQGPWGGVGATVYTEVVSWSVLVNDPFTGYAVTATTADVLGVVNNSGTSVTARILIVGEV